MLIVSVMGGCLVYQKFLLLHNLSTQVLFRKHLLYLFLYLSTLGGNLSWLQLRTLTIVEEVNLSAGYDEQHGKMGYQVLVERR